MHLANLIFVVIGVVDFKRKLFYQRIMGYLLTPERAINGPIYSYMVPTIDIFDAQNLRKWMIMRKASLDLGKKFTYRIFMYSSIFIAIYGLMAGVFTLTLFGFLKYEIPLQAIILAYFDIVVILGILLQMMKTGAAVNQHFSIHKGILLRLKGQFLQLITNYEHFKNMKAINCEIKRALLDRIQEMGLSEEEIKEKADESLAVIDYNIEQLDFDVENDSLKLIGITCTNEVLNSIYTSLVSFALFTVQYVFSQGLI